MNRTNYGFLNFEAFVSLVVKIKTQADFGCFNGLGMLSWNTTVIARPAKQAVAISVFDN